MNDTQASPELNDHHRSGDGNQPYDASVFFTEP